MVFKHRAGLTNATLTLSLPVTRICVNFSTVYNDTLVAKGLNIVWENQLMSKIELCMNVDFPDFISSVLCINNMNVCGFIFFARNLVEMFRPFRSTVLWEIKNLCFCRLQWCTYLYKIIIVLICILFQLFLSLLKKWLSVNSTFTFILLNIKWIFTHDWTNCQHFYD